MNWRALGKPRLKLRCSRICDSRVRIDSASRLGSQRANISTLGMAISSYLAATKREATAWRANEWWANSAANATRW